MSKGVKNSRSGQKKSKTQNHETKAVRRRTPKHERREEVIKLISQLEMNNKRKKKYTPEYFQKMFAKVMKKHRESHGISREELAFMMGCAYITIANIENDAQMAGIKFILRFCTVFNISLSELSDKLGL